MGVVYIAANKTSGKCYIGRTIESLRRRMTSHFAVARKGSDTLFCRAIRKYGENSFEWGVLFESDDKTEILQKEREFIALIGTKAPNGYNLTEGGDGSFGFHPSQEIIEKIRVKTKGLKRSEETRRRMGAWQIGRKMSRESVEKIIAANTGRKHTEEARRHMSEAHQGRDYSYRLGKHHSEETRRKMSEAHKGRPKSKEWAEKIGAAHRGKPKGKMSPEVRQRKTERERFTKAINRLMKRSVGMAG